MAACMNQLCAAVFVKEPGSLGQGRRNGISLHGSKNPLGWRIHPEVVWVGHGIRNQRRSNSFHLSVTGDTSSPQNVDMPLLLPTRKKKPSVLPKRSKKNRRPPVAWQDPAVRAPANGLLVKHLIPVAHDVLEAKAIVRRGVDLLRKEITVVACRFCSEVHVGSNGHNLRTCKGPKMATRGSLHDWVKATSEDILVPIDAYHLQDRLALPISHDQRFDVDRISAIEELCIQAGVDVAEYPTLRRTEPVQPSTKKKREDASWMGGQFTFYTSEGSYMLSETSEQKERKGKREKGVEEAEDDLGEGYQRADIETVEEPSVNLMPLPECSVISSKEELVPLIDVSDQDCQEIIAHKTFQAWERMKQGVKKLMTKYRVVACGYCPEIHVGPRGHRGRSCGAFKHQWRNGQHGWQDASIDELIPPQYVWHMRDRFGPPLENALRRFYGKAPALVELCVQGGMSVPEDYKALMRLDIAIPTVDEFENVV